MCGFENILKRGQCGGNLCNDPCGDVYKDVCLLKRFSMFLKVVLKVCCDVCFEKWQGLFGKFGQVTKSYLP